MAALALHLAAATALAQTAGNIDTIAGTGTSGYSASEDGGAATSARLNNPSAVAADAAGNIYIADYSNSRVRSVDAATGNISTRAAGSLTGPNGLAVDAAGNLYVSDTSVSRVRRVTPAGAVTTFAGGGSSVTGNNIPATSVLLNSPYGLAADGSGNIYIADTSSNRIRRVTPDGVMTIIAGTGAGSSSGDGGAATSATVNTPTGVAADGSGNIYIAEQAGNRVRRVDAATGNISTYAGTGSAGFSGDGGAATSAQLSAPYDVAADGSGNLYIADFSNNRIRRVDAATGNISTVAGGGSALGDGGAATSARLNGPTGITFDCAGNLYIADFNNHRVRRVFESGAPCPPPPPPPEPETVVTEAPEPEPAAQPVGVSELSFAPAASSSMPAPQTLTLRAEGGAVDFQALPSARWIEVSSADGNMAQYRGRLAEGETITLRVTVNPLGLRPGTHRGRLYIRSGGRITATIRIVLEVPPPTGPAVTENGGVFSAARMSAYGERGLFGPQLLPLAPGSLVVVQGVNFASGGRMEAAGFPLPTMLGGARLLIDGAEVPLIAVEPRRIEAQLPWALGGEAAAAGGLALAEVVVESGGESSYPRRFWTAPRAPGVFTVSGESQGQALAVFAGTTDLAAPLGFRAGSRPARGGDVLEIYATGLGAVEPPIADGMNSCAPNGVCLADGSNVVLRHTAARPRVWIGGWPLPAESVLFSGLAPDLAGVNVVTVELPTWLPPSEAAELRLAVGGASSQSGVTVAVE